MGLRKGEEIPGSDERWCKLKEKERLLREHFLDELAMVYDSTYNEVQMRPVSNGVFVQRSLVFLSSKGVQRIQEDGLDIPLKYDELIYYERNNNMNNSGLGERYRIVTGFYPTPRVDIIALVGEDETIFSIYEQEIVTQPFSFELLFDKSIIEEMDRVEVGKILFQEMREIYNTQSIVRGNTRGVLTVDLSEYPSRTSM